MHTEALSQKQLGVGEAENNLLSSSSLLIYIKTKSDTKISFVFKLHHMKTLPFQLLLFKKVSNRIF